MSRNNRGQPPPPPSGSQRMNEYFVPRDGIDREVITADICRYLGNDALVRPGLYQNPQTGQSVSGYFITAYRNLTTAMIDDLKNDSNRWEMERRQQAAQRNPSGVQYHQSTMYRERAQQEQAGYTTSRDQYEASQRYPGSNQPGYSGNPASPYQTQGGGYSSSQYPSQVAYAPDPSERYQGMPPPSGNNTQGYGLGQPGQDSPAYIQTGVHYAATSSPDPSYGSARIPTSSSASSQSYTTSSGQPAGYYQQTQASAQYAHPQDPFYGRSPYSQAPSGSSQTVTDYGSARGQVGYPTAQDPRYKDNSPGPARSGQPSAQIPTTATSTRRDLSSRHDRSSRR